MAIHRIWFAPSSCRCRTICSTGPATCSRSLDNEKRPLCRPSVSSPSTASPASRRSHRWSSAQQNHIHNIIKVHTSELVGISNQPYNSGFAENWSPDNYWSLRGPSIPIIILSTANIFHWRNLYAVVTILLNITYIGLIAFLNRGKRIGITIINIYIYHKILIGYKVYHY